MLGDKLAKPEADQVMENAADGHFSGLHYDEYPVTKHKGANKVPFIIGMLQCYSVERMWREFVLPNVHARVLMS
jgi:hypothetical protein